MPPVSAELRCRAMGAGVVACRREGGRLSEGDKGRSGFPHRCCGKDVRESPGLAVMVVSASGKGFLGASG